MTHSGAARLILQLGAVLDGTSQDLPNHGMLRPSSVLASTVRYSTQTVTPHLQGTRRDWHNCQNIH